MTAIEDLGPAHQVDRITYQCLACDRPWPCDPAREYLLVTMGDDRPQLTIRMWDDLEDAALGPLRYEPVADLVERFVRWTA